MTIHERMVQAFAALNDDGRHFWLACIEQEVRALQRKRAEQSPRPALRLIQGGLSAVSTKKPRALLRTKKKEGK